MSAVSCVAFNFASIDGKVIEVFRFSFDWKIFLLKCLVSLLTSAICWLIRTRAMVHVSANVVAVMMPMSSVVAAVFSIIVGTDTLSKNLVIGGILVVCASIISNLAGIKRESKPKKDESRDEIS